MTRVQLGSFSLEAPAAWKLSTVILAGPTEAPAGPAAMPSARAVRPFQRNLVATMEPADARDTLEGYVKRQIDGLKQAGVSRMDAGKPEKLKLNGGPEALLTEQIILGSGGERVRQMQL